MPGCGSAAPLPSKPPKPIADYAYKSAGVDAIFLGTTFERRFRDIHTLSQQIQSRTAHFESVGQIMLGIEPPGTFL